MSAIIFLAYNAGKQYVIEKYFYHGSQEFLNGNRIDLPEEISEIKDLNDSEPDYFTGVRDSAKSIIHIEFDNKDYSDYYHEYQLDVDQDSIYLYDKQRRIGSVPFGCNPSIDSLILKDNL